MSNAELTFNTLLAQAIAQGDRPAAFLDQSARQGLLDQLKEVREEPGKPKLFDRVSLKHIASLFDAANEFYEALQDNNHPAYLIYSNPTEWFRQSYKFMYEPVAFFEIVRFFAGGKTQEEKEITFRVLIAKIIKTQETVQKIAKNGAFLKRYFEKYPALHKEYPSILAKQKNLSQTLSPAQSILHAMKGFIDSTSKSCLDLLEELDIELPEVAKSSANSELYYEALVLTMRHTSSDLFGELGSDDYSILVEELTKVCQKSQLFPEVFLFQNAKREYLIDWLVHTLRKNDLTSTKAFYQAGKAEIYYKFKPISINPDILQQLHQREHLENPEVIEEEIASLEALTEDDLYQLLLRIYTAYKHDDLLGNNMPLAPQSLSSSGDITWEKQNIVSLVDKKVKDFESMGKAGREKASRFTSMFVSLKKASKVFTVALKKVDEKKQQAHLSQTEKPSEKTEVSAQPSSSPPPPPMQVEHKGVAIEPCFPLPVRDCLNPVPGQKQDLSFNNSDNQAGVAPAEQECIINMFNLENKPNQPTINSSYFVFSNAIAMILQTYDDKVVRVQKKYVSGVNVNSFAEEVLYLRVKEDVILTLGITQMGERKNFGNLPKKQTTYFRLFVKGGLSQGLNKYKVPSILKEFKVDDKIFQFKEIAMPTHYKKDPKYQGILVDALAAVVESLPQEQFDQLNEEETGFIHILQQKAKFLVEQQGVALERNS